MENNAYGRRFRTLARSAADAIRNPPDLLHPGVLLRRYRISWSISDGNKSAALRLVEKVASKKEAMRLVDFLLKNRIAVTQLRRERSLRHNLLDTVLARVVLEFGLHEVSSLGLFTMATWLENATYLGRNVWGRRQGADVSPLCRTLSALLESEPDISGQYPDLAKGIYCDLVPALVMWFHRGHAVRYVPDGIVNSLLFRLLKLAGPHWTSCPREFLCMSPMLRILRNVRPWRLHECSSMVALSKMRKGFLSLMFNQCVLGQGFTIPDSWFVDLLEILCDILSGAPTYTQPDNDDFFHITLSTLFHYLCRLKDSEHKAHRRRLIKLVFWFAAFLPRHDDNPFDQATQAQVAQMFPTFVWRIRQPLSLRQNSAIAIRRQLGFGRLRQISELGPLPPRLENFLERGFFEVDDAFVDFIASERLS